MREIFNLQSEGKLPSEVFSLAASALVNVGRVADARHLAMLRPKYSCRQVKLVDELIFKPLAEIKHVSCEQLGCTNERCCGCFTTVEQPALSDCSPERKLRYTRGEKQTMGIVFKQNPDTDAWEFSSKAFNAALFVEEVLKQFYIAYEPKKDVYYMFLDGAWREQEKGASSTLRVVLMGFFDRLVPGFEWTPSLETKYLSRLAHRCKRTSLLLAPPENLINAKNGLIDWAGEQGIRLLPHDPQYFFKYHIGVDYKPKAKCETFDMFLAAVTKNDESMMKLLRQWLGYVLTPSTQAEMALFTYGSAANGKSSYLQVMRRLAGGDDGASDVPLRDILNYRFGLYNIISKTVNISTELSSITDASFSVFKQIVSGETINGEAKGKNQFSVRIMNCSCQVDS